MYFLGGDSIYVLFEWYHTKHQASFTASIRIRNWEHTFSTSAGGSSANTRRMAAISLVWCCRRSYWWCSRRMTKQSSPASSGRWGMVGGEKRVQSRSTPSEAKPGSLWTCGPAPSLAATERQFRRITQIFTSARYAKCFKLGSKPSWLYVSQISNPRFIIIVSLNEMIFYVYTFTYTLSATRLLSSSEDLCIYAYVAAGNIYIYIYIYRERERDKTETEKERQIYKIDT